MKSYQEKLKKIKKCSQMKTEEDMRNFDMLLSELYTDQNIEVFEELMDLFNDDCDYPNVMFCLVHALEAYPDHKYVEGVIKKVKDYNKYPEWFKVLLYGILNNKKCLNILKQNLHLAKKEHLEELFDMIYEESEEHRPIIEELRNILRSI